MELDHYDWQIIRQLQEDIPLVKQPFAMLAEKLGINEQEYLVRMKNLTSNGALRRIAAILRHYESGYASNAMLAWEQEESQADYVGKQLAQFENISHLYLRTTDETWPYNMYAMVHARSEEELAIIAGKIADLTGNQAICMVKSVHEYKKVSMQYQL